MTTLPANRTDEKRGTTRRAGLTMTITDQDGAKPYTVLPERSPSDCLRSWVLSKKYADPNRPGIYRIRLHADGKTDCRCDGNKRHGHCRHVEALEALGVIDPSQMTALATARAELEAAVLEHQRQAALYVQERTALAQAAGLLPPAPEAPKTKRRSRKARQEVQA